MRRVFIIILIFCLSPFCVVSSVYSGQRETIPAAVGIMLNKSMLLSAQGKHAEALAVLETFHHKKDNVDEEKARSRGYTHDYIYFYMGNCLLMLQRVDEAATRYREAVKQKPDFTEAWLNLAKCLYELEKMEPAAEAFLKGYESQYPGNPMYLYYSAVCQAAAGKWNASYTLFQRLIHTHPDEIKLEWKETLVHVLLSLDKNRDALPVIVELSEKTQGKKQRQWREVRLYQYMTLDMEDKALAYARWLIGVDTTEPTWWKALAHLAIQKEQYKQGLAALIAYSFLKPLSDDEAELIADLHMALNIPARAVHYYETALKDTLDQDTLKKLVQAHMQLYERDQALTLLDNAAKDNPLPFDLAMLKGELLFEQGHYSQAFTLFDQLGQSNSTSGRPYLMMGYCAWNQRNTQGAISAFEKASGFEKEKREAEKAIAQLRMTNDE